MTSRWSIFQPMVEMQTCDGLRIALVQRRSRLGCSLIVSMYAHNRLSFPKHLNSAVINLLGGLPSILKLLNIILVILIYLERSFSPLIYKQLFTCGFKFTNKCHFLHVIHMVKWIVDQSRYFIFSHCFNVPCMQNPHFTPSLLIITTHNPLTTTHVSLYKVKAILHT